MSMIKTFSTEGMKEIPNLGEDFRVGLFIGKCVGRHFDYKASKCTAVIMKSNQPARCAKCCRVGLETEEDVSFCAICENYSEFIPEDVRAWLNSGL